MEGYQNYQQVINAIKAEYVNARNLKKTAIAKKRVATNAKSFKTRKEGEKTTLETKLIAVKSDLDSTLSTAINNLEDAKFELLITKLSELKGKLAFIDAEIFRLEERHSVDPDNIASFPSADPTTIESQSLTVLRNMLSVTIADAELVITDLYTGQDYTAIKSATIPNQLTDNQQEVGYHYMHLLNVFSELFDKVKSELDDFVIGIFFAGDAVNSYRNNLILDSEALVNFKSQLADLLNDGGTESEINAKEQQIEDLKEIMLSKATELKQIEISISSGMSNQKLVKLKRYATDLHSAAEESRYYRMANNDFLKHQFPFTELDITYRSFELYSGVFEFMDSGENPQSPSRLFQNGQMTEFKLLKNKITQDKNYYRMSQQEMNSLHDDTYALNQPQRLFDCDERNSGNGTEYYNITDFLPNVSQETKDFYVTYSRQLHLATSNYINEKTRYDLYKNHISNHVNYFNSIIDEQFNNISALRSIKSQHSWLQEDFFRYHNGHYEGTPEQDNLLSNTKGIWIEAESEFLSQFYLNRSKMKTFDLYNTIFPEFYSTLSTLESNLDNLNNNMSSLNTTYTDLQNSKNAAYEYLQELTVGEAAYVAALADYEAKVASFEPIYAEWLNMMNGPGGTVEAYNFLQTTLAGEAEYQAGLADYETKLANKDASYIEKTRLFTEYTDAYDFLQNMIRTVTHRPMTDLPEFNVAVADLESKELAFTTYENEVYNPIVALFNASIEAAFSSEANQLHYVYLGAQSDYDTKLAAKDAYYSDVVTPVAVLRNDAYTFLQDLTDEDAAYQAGLIDWNSKQDAETLFYQESYIPAVVALNNAVDERNQYSSNSVWYGSDINLSLFGFTGQDLKGFKDNKDYSDEQLQQAEVAKDTSYNAYSEAKNQMTLVPSTPQQKREGMRREHDLHKVYEQKNRLTSLVSRYTQLLPTLVDQMGSFVNEVRSRNGEDNGESFFDGLLQNVKNFMDGSNLYSNKLRDLRMSEIESGKREIKMREIYEPLLRDWNMEFGSDNNQNQNIARSSDDAIQRLSTNNGIDNLKQTIQNMNNELFRNDHGFSFADRIINEVNNGTPLI